MRILHMRILQKYDDKKTGPSNINTDPILREKRHRRQPHSLNKS